MALISGLPDDIAYDCLSRVEYDQFPTVVSVCKGWKAEVELPVFLQHRKVAGRSQRLIVMVQAHVVSNHGVFKSPDSPVYRLTICEPDLGNWSELPLLADFADGLPMFCQLAAVGSDLVVMGGCDPLTWTISKSVFIYNFVSGAWRRGTDMPGDGRIFFGCAADSERMVYVAGGHDNEKNALRSSMAYDVAKDEWIPLPDMARERDECKAIFRGGKLHVIGGYCTEMQGRFERSTETFNISTWLWNQVQEGFLQVATCPRTCVDGDDETMYMCRGDDVVQQKHDTWKFVAKLPAQVRNPDCVTAWQGKVLVIGSAGFGEPHMAYVLHLEDYTWTKLETPHKYSGHVQSSCYLEV